jgi:uncharacterized protein (UPF0248 family)
LFDNGDDFMTYPREVLNELRWKPGENLAEASITYVHRGAPGDEMTISGGDIVELEHSFFVTKDAMIPYHRIKLICYRARVIFDIEKASSRDDTSENKEA